jgi:TatD DNase family protein
MLIDTHAHIYHQRFAADLDDIILRARDSGVEKIVLPAIDVASILEAIDLAERYDGIYAMAALHPSETKEATDVEFDQVAKLAEHPAVVAIGESGLDYYWDRGFDEQQHDFFRRHIRLAAGMDLPLILHNREASDDLVRILREERDRMSEPDKLRGIFHCFGGTHDYADSAEEMNFLLGIGGTVTFKNSGVAELVKEISLDRIVLETDAPYLAPEPYRGKRNEPSYVRYVAERIAAIKEVHVSIVAEVTSRNARGIFGI